MDTTIRVSDETRQQLEELKIHPKESYNDVITRLIAAYIDDEPLSVGEIKGIEEALADIKAGRIYALSEVREEISEDYDSRISDTAHGKSKKRSKKTPA